MSKKRSMILITVLAIYLALVTQRVEWFWFDYLFFFLKLLCFFFLLNWLLPLIDRISFSFHQSKFNKKDYVLLFIYIFIILLVALIFYYPENFQYDIRNQYEQVINHQYSDWHPVIHTLVFFRLPTLFIQHEIMCCLFQMVLISFILLYFCYTLNKWGISKKMTFIILSLFIFNPSFDMMAISPIKDTIFSYCLFLSTLSLINIYCSEGLWLKSKINMVLFFITCFGITFFRHNGIVNFFAIMFFLIILYKNIRKRSICIFLIILSLRFVFVPYFYGLNHIKKTNVNISEMVCILLNQMDYIYTHNGNMTKNQIKQLGKFQNLGSVQQNYNAYNYNSVKYPMDYHKNYAFYINQHPLEFFQLWKSLVTKNKVLAIKSYFYTTYCIWHMGIDTTTNNKDLVFINGNIKVSNQDSLYSIYDGYFTYKNSISNCFFSIIFPTVAMGMFYIFFSLLYCLLRKKSKFVEKLKLLLPFVPVLSNLFVIMLLLPGRETRFVYSNILCSYLLLIFAFLQKRTLSRGE